MDMCKLRLCCGAASFLQLAAATALAAPLRNGAISPIIETGAARLPLGVRQ